MLSVAIGNKFVRWDYEVNWNKMYSVQMVIPEFVFSNIWHIQRRLQRKCKVEEVVCQPTRIKRRDEG